MGRPPRPPVFVGRGAYRLRRWRDAARVLPVAGLVLWLVPLVWTRGEMANSGALLYIFGIWVVLIAAAALIGRRVRPDDDDAGEPD